MILEAQNQHELSISPGTPYISDRGPDPIVYARFYVDPDAGENLAESLEGRQCLERYRKCLVVLLCPIPPTDDNFCLVQDPEEQKTFTDEMIAIFHQYKIPYVYIYETDPDKRMHMLNDAVNGNFVIYDTMLQNKMPVCITFVSRIRPVSSSVYVRSFVITTKAIHCQYYQYGVKERDRMVDRYGTSKFVRLEFDNNVPLFQRQM